jgi:leader peptidase (prepilin peptidase)/N-methyltransferase
VLVGNLVADPSPAWPVAGALLFLGFFLAAMLNPSGLGMGDVKLAALIGVGCGSSTLLAVIAGCVLLLCYIAIVFVRAGVAAGRKQTFPFVPFLAAGAVVAVLFG